jgi:hypothetical protein
MQIHGVRYAGEASVQVNASAWVPLNNDTVTVAEPGKSYGGIGGGFSALVLTLSLPTGLVVDGLNTVRFRFNRTDGLVSAYRILALNFLTADGKKILPATDFLEESPESWAPPLPDPASIEEGKKLWHNATLVASSLPGSPRIRAHCADCHAQDGRDLKYFNYSNASIVARSRFHGLSTLQGAQIASYIRTLTAPSPGRPWNPPYQPGPGLDSQPVSRWAAGAGLAWVLAQDTDSLPYLINRSEVKLRAIPSASLGTAQLRELVGQVTPDIFRPDGNLNPREVPISLQLPDWNRWLPHVHPKDAWGSAFAESNLALLYGEDPTVEGSLGGKRSLRSLLMAAPSDDRDIRPVLAAFASWVQQRHAFLRRVLKARTWSSALTDKVYSTQLWQLVKTWELTQEFGLEKRSELLEAAVQPRSWFNTIPAETAPSAVPIPDGPNGVGGSALTNEYFISSWYQLQIILNSGNHQHRDRGPLDWVYVVGHFRDLYAQTHQAEPMRVLLVVIKALQSTDPRIGPDDYRRGWRPEQNIDPRIMISPLWQPIFRSLPRELRCALTSSLLSAWMDKNLQYPIAAYLPIGVLKHAYRPSESYGMISGGRVWEAAQDFLDAGVSRDLVDRLLDWGTAFTDRAARIQYERYRPIQQPKRRIKRAGI